MIKDYIFCSSIIIFFIPYGALYHGIDAQGRDMNDYSLLSFTIYTALLVVVTGQIMFDTSYWTVFNYGSIIGSLILYFGCVIFIYQGWFLKTKIYALKNLYFFSLHFLDL